MIWREREEKGRERRFRGFVWEFFKEGKGKEKGRSERMKLRVFYPKVG